MNKEKRKEYNQRPEVKERQKRYDKEWVKNNTEKIKQYRKNFYKKNKEKVLERQKKYYLKIKDKPETKEYKKQYWNKTKDNYNKIKRDKYKEDKDYRNIIDIRNKLYKEKNKESMNKYHKEYYKQNPDKFKYKKRKMSLKSYCLRLIYQSNYTKNKLKTDAKFAIRKRIGSRMRTYVVNYLDNGKLIKSQSYKQIDWKSVIKHLDDTKPKNWRECHIDHIRPLFSFDLTNEKELIKANLPENLQWLTAKENMKKGSKYNYKEVKANEN